nr:MAG TPA: hypothetical protein [Caudoviricetes sp.]
MIDLTNRGSRCLYHVRLFRDLYISAFVDKLSKSLSESEL